MSRYRPPAPPKSPYITPEGAKALRNELNQLWKIDRPEVTLAVQAAAKNGDRSENGDYIYGKQKLREIDRRVRYLSKRLEEITIVDKLPSNQSVIYFGATISLLTESGEPLTVRIVGADEISSKKNHISIDSPLAKQLIGKQVGNNVGLQADGKPVSYEIIAISYG